MVRQCIEEESDNVVLVLEEEQGKEVNGGEQGR